MYNEVKLPIQTNLLKHLEQAILFVHKSGKIIKGNPSALSLLNISNTEMDQLTLADFFDENILFAEEVTRSLIELKNGYKMLIDIKSIKIDDDLFCLLMNKVSLENKTIEIKKHIERLREVSSEGLILFNQEYIIDCDLVFANMFGYTQEEIRGMNIEQLIDEKSTNTLEYINDYPGKSHELTGVRKNGETLHIELIDHPYMGEENMVRIAIIKDVSERVAHEKRLEYMAFFDELTDLPNRNYFIKILEDAINEAAETNESLAVYFIDLDYFKEINETLGYDFGDQVLVASAKRLQKFKAMNTFAARIGGDEFLILQRHITDAHPPIELAESLISVFEEPIIIDGYEVFTSISIGISVFPKNGSTANDLIKHADSAMYVIKEEHRNNYKFFESSISEKFKTMLTMESDLRTAIKEGQFELHYQPQKSLVSKKIVGMEALLRWKHPTKGNIPPMDFIPLAEKTGLIIEIGDWVLKQACIQNKKWQMEGYEPIIVCVNLSAKQFHQKDLVEKIKKVLHDTGLEAKYLELEITESMAMSNEHYILKTMKRLRNLGVYVSIDDFGTGYSSLKYLSKFPITKLKIDKMFMDKKQKQNQAIVKSIIKMSHSLNMKVIAEGVETFEQFKFLEQEKCDVIQGYYFSKPLPPKDLSGFLRPSQTV